MCQLQLCVPSKTAQCRSHDGAEVANEPSGRPFIYTGDAIN